MKLTNDQLFTCADLCVDSYSDKCPDGFRDVDDLRYGIHDINDVRYITIRGTANAENAFRDVWVRPSRICSAAWVHKGFASGFERLCKELRGCGSVVWTGHSFGAAVALLFADTFGGPVVTFGCPRPYLRLSGEGNPLHVRVRNDDDPVTMIPAMFYHMPQPGQDIVLKDSDHEWIDVKDHSMEIYRARLRRYYEKANSAAGSGIV